MDGWEADSNASKLMQGLGLDESIMYSQMADLGGNEKVKVLLAQALFGDPDIILLDEPTNHLDLQAIEWLEDFLLDYEGTVIVVSHDRYFLNVVCTHIVDIDYSKVKMYVGNYEFWYESSQMMERLIKQQNKKAEEKLKNCRLLFSGSLRISRNQNRLQAVRKCLINLQLKNCLRHQDVIRLSALIWTEKRDAICLLLTDFQRL